MNTDKRYVLAETSGWQMAFIAEFERLDDAVARLHEIRKMNEENTHLKFELLFRISDL